MNKRTKSTSVSTNVRLTVMARDKNHCIFCGSHQMLSVAHYIPRSRAGLGIEQNLAVVCMPCHMRLDQSIYRKEMLIVYKRYLVRQYGEFDECNLIYKKGK